VGGVRPGAEVLVLEDGATYWSGPAPVPAIPAHFGPRYRVGARAGAACEYAWAERVIVPNPVGPPPPPEPESCDVPFPNACLQR
jgi:hypothetical protein